MAREPLRASGGEPVTSRAEPRLEVTRPARSMMRIRSLVAPTTERASSGGISTLTLPWVTAEEGSAPLIVK